MSRILHITLIAALTVIAGCRKTLPLPEVKSDRKIVLLGEMVAGDSISIRAGQSLPLTGQNLKFAIVEGLTIDIEEQTGKKYSLTGVPDSLTQYLYTIPFTSINKITAGNTYTINTNHATLKAAKVKVTIPEPFTASVKDTATVMYAQDTTFRISVNINDMPGENYYVVEALKQIAQQKVFFLHKGTWLERDANRELYDSLSTAGQQLQIKVDTTYTNSYVRHELYTKDERTENARTGNQYSVNKRVLIKDNTFSNGVCSLEVFVRKNKFLQADRSDKGRTIIVVKSVTPEYFNYLTTYEHNVNQEEGRNLTSYPEQLKGNVENGLGVIGGVYQLKFYYQLDSYDL